MLGSVPIGGQGVGGEPQELGDDIFSAILVGDTTGGMLPSANEAGFSTFLSNTTSSPGPNEPPNNGAPVWFYWQAHVLTHPVDLGGGGLTDQRLTEVRMRFGVRRRSFIINAHQTTFPTEMTAFKALRWPVTGYGDLQQLFINPRDITDRRTRATRYAYWEDQSQIEFDATGLPYDALGRVGTDAIPDPSYTSSPNTLDLLNSLPGKGYYFIRVDSAKLANGSIKRGNFTLWWEMADRGYKISPLGPGGAGCAFCAPAKPLDNGVCLLTFQPNIHKTPTTDIAVYPPFGGNAPAATYVVTYCGGAWNYYFGWAVGQIPPGADQTWGVGGIGGDPPTEPGYFFNWQYANSGVQYGHFTETFVSSGTDTYTTPRGYRSAAMAEDRMGNPPPGGHQIGCPQMFFTHDGSSPITLRWTDQLDGNAPGPSGAPVYTLGRIAPVFGAISACGNLVSGSTYDVSFTFEQDLNVNFFNVSCTCLLEHGVTASNTITGRTIFSANAFPFTNTFVLRITVNPLLHKQVVATLQFSDFSGVLGTLDFDLAPYVVMLNEVAVSPFGCPAYTLGESIQFRVLGLPADNLTLQIDPEHTATSAIANTSCVLTTTFNLGAVGCAGTVLVFYFNHLGNGVTTLPLYWNDGATALPPSVVYLA